MAPPPPHSTAFAQSAEQGTFSRSRGPKKGQKKIAGKPEIRFLKLCEIFKVGDKWALSYLVDTGHIFRFF